MIIGFVDDGIGPELTDLSIRDGRGCPITLCRISDSRQCQMSEVDNEKIMVLTYVNWSSVPDLGVIVQLEGLRVFIPAHKVLFFTTVRRPREVIAKISGMLLASGSCVMLKVLKDWNKARRDFSQV